MHFYNNPEIKEGLITAEQDVLQGRQTSFIAAQRLLDKYFQSIG